jgi:hypothetical protein
MRGRVEGEWALGLRLARGSGTMAGMPAESVHTAMYRDLVDPESRRLAADAQRIGNWKRWGPYLSERQWGTVREDYSASGDCWGYFPHEHARSRAYRWGEDGLLGWTDRECRLCFAVALWNGRDPILKERLFGLTNPEGTCGEDVKEAYFYLDSTPTHSYCKGLYCYPQAEFPYQRLLEESRRRTRGDGEFELADTGVFDAERYFDVQVEYAKQHEEDTLIRIRVTNRAVRGADAEPIHVLPTLWFRNGWAWGCRHEDCAQKPTLSAIDDARVLAVHETLGRFVLEVDGVEVDGEPGGAGVGVGGALLFTENETNVERLFGRANPQPYVKDAFHRYVIEGDRSAVNPGRVGTKCAAHFALRLRGGASATIRLRLRPEAEARGGQGVAGRHGRGFGPGFDATMDLRREEADRFYAGQMPLSMPKERAEVARQAYAGLLWNKQFYHYVVEDWLTGDARQPVPPEERKRGRNADWGHLFSRDVLSMPDKWEYPWFAAWDTAFHMIAMAQIDPAFAKSQLLLFLREWYMHPSGAMPAYEFAFDDVNPPVHAWACWRVYKITAPPGQRDRGFLERAFQKLLLNFTWWINRKDPTGHNLFGGGFLGLDNIGVFDRSHPLPPGVTLLQADGTAWMAFYCGTMLSMALELALHNPAYEDIASKFFEHFIRIADAIHTLGGTGLWDAEDRFYYDQIRVDRRVFNPERLAVDPASPVVTIPLRLRSLVGILPIMAVEAIPESTVNRLEGFRKRTRWFLKHRQDLAAYTSHMVRSDRSDLGHYLLAIPTREHLSSVLRYVLDEREFLSPYGIRSLSKVYEASPYVFKGREGQHVVRYNPAESDSGTFGGNSNWRGPVWFPLNYLLIESLERWHRFFGNAFTIECPTGSGNMMNLSQVAQHLSERLGALFLPGERGVRPALAGERMLMNRAPGGAGAAGEAGGVGGSPLLFHEYFHGDTGRGLGASHQTGWTALVAPLLADKYWRLDKERATKG